MPPAKGGRMEINMRRTRIATIIIFIIASAAFGYYKYDMRNSQDQTGPVIRMDENSITVSVKAEESELLAGISAVDEKDGDVTDSLLIESLSNFLEKGVRTMTVAAFDSDGHITKVRREVVYKDYNSPRFALSKPLKFVIGTENITANMTAEDVIDGNITDKIKISGEYSLSSTDVGDYPMEFTVTNSMGDVVKLPATVTLYTASEEKLLPQIELSDYLIYISKGETLHPWDYMKKITLGTVEYQKDAEGVLQSEFMNEDGSFDCIMESEVIILDEVDCNTEGTYEVTYQFYDKEGNIGTVRLIVVVSE